MNLIQRLHDNGLATHIHSNDHHREHKVPFWVRHYDIIVNLVTLGRTGTVHSQTLSLAKLQSGDAILDIGCGTGKLLLAAEGIVGPKGMVVGLDVEPAMIQQARNRASSNQSSAHFDVASIEHVPYPNETFDVAFSTLMYHHLTTTEKEAAFTEVHRVLKPKGRLIIVDINPARRTILTSLPGHSNIDREDYVRSEVKARMQGAGFIVVEDGPHPSKQLSYVIGKKAQS